MTTKTYTDTIISEANALVGCEPCDYEEAYRRMLMKLTVQLASLNTQVNMMDKFNNDLDNHILFTKIVGFPEEPGLYLYQPPGTFGLRMIDVSWSKEGPKDLVDTYGVQVVSVRNYKGNWYKIKGQYHDVRTDA